MKSEFLIQASEGDLCRYILGQTMQDFGFDEKDAIKELEAIKRIADFEAREAALKALAEKKDKSRFQTNDGRRFAAQPARDEGTHAGLRVIIIPKNGEYDAEGGITVSILDETLVRLELLNDPTNANQTKVWVTYYEPAMEDYVKKLLAPAMEPASVSATHEVPPAGFNLTEPPYTIRKGHHLNHGELRKLGKWLEDGRTSGEAWKNLKHYINCSEYHAKQVLKNYLEGKYDA